MSSISAKRILREISQIEKDIPDEIKFVQPNGSLETFYFDMKVSNNPLYPSGEIYRLKFVIDENYPFESPQVQFITDNSLNIKKIPIHPHIYSNGHICLDILGDKWVPVQNMLSTTLSIHSLLVTNTRDERPPDDKSYIKHASSNPKNSRFIYHDDTV